MGATRCRCCRTPGHQRWTARACEGGGRASWDTGLRGCSARWLPLCSRRGCSMSIFRNSSGLHQALFKSMAPCILELLCSLPTLSLERFVRFLEVILRQSGVAFLNLCWHYATKKLNSTREAGRRSTMQLYKGMSKNESLSSLQETKRLITEELRNRL